MFNLPFPTDSLYKFCFMFGLALIVFSIYFRDSHLNRYDKNQPKYILDSLNNRLTVLDNIRYEDSYFLFINGRSLNDFFRLNLRLDVHNAKIALNNWEQFERSYREQYLKSDTSLRNLCVLMDNNIKAKKDTELVKHYLSFILQIRTQNNRVTEECRNKISFYDSNIRNDYLSDLFVSISGILLFVFGTLLWYFKIQRYQDKILKLQVVEASKGATNSKNKLFGRKHHDPINRIGTRG